MAHASSAPASTKPSALHEEQLKMLSPYLTKDFDEAALNDFLVKTHAWAQASNHYQQEGMIILCLSSPTAPSTEIPYLAFGANPEATTPSAGAGVATASSIDPELIARTLTEITALANEIFDQPGTLRYDIYTEDISLISFFKGTSASKELEALAQNLDDERTACTHYQKENTELHAEVLELQTRIEKLHKQNKQQAQKQTTEVRTLTEEIKKAETTISELEAKLAATKRELADARKTAATKEKTSKTDIAHASETATRAAEEAAEKEMAKVRSISGEVERRLGEARAQLTAQAKLTDAQTATINKLKAELTAAKRLIAQLTPELEEHKKQIAALTAETEEKRATAARIHEQKATLEKQIATLQAEITAMSTLLNKAKIGSGDLSRLKRLMDVDDAHSVTPASLAESTAEASAAAAPPPIPATGAEAYMPAAATVFAAASAGAGIPRGYPTPLRFPFPLIDPTTGALLLPVMPGLASGTNMPPPITFYSTGTAGGPGTVYFPLGYRPPGY